MSTLWMLSLTRLRKKSARSNFWILRNAFIHSSRLFAQYTTRHGHFSCRDAMRRPQQPQWSMIDFSWL